MIWNGMVWYGESDRLSSHWWGECIRQVLLLNHLVYHPVNQHRCGKSTIRKSCPEETTMKFHSIPELYVRLRIPFDTQTWLKKTREFYVFSDAHGQLMSCQLDGPVETHCESKGTVVRSCCFSFGRGWVRNVNIFSKDFVWLLSLGKPGVSPETDI